MLERSVFLAAFVLMIVTATIVLLQLTGDSKVNVLPGIALTAFFLGYGVLSRMKPRRRR